MFKIYPLICFANFTGPAPLVCPANFTGLVNYIFIIINFNSKSKYCNLNKKQNSPIKYTALTAS